MSSVTLGKPQIVSAPTTPAAPESKGITVDVNVKVNVSPEAIQASLDTLLKNAREAGLDVTGLLFKGVATAVSHLGSHVGLAKNEDKPTHEGFVAGTLRGISSLLGR